MLEYVKMYKGEQFMVVGGAQIYEAFMPYVNTMYLTQIQEYAPADTYFPKFDIKDWDISMIANEWQEKVPYMIKKYVRKR
jgi:dihydrofolate reductase